MNLAEEQQLYCKFCSEKLSDLGLDIRARLRDGNSDLEIRKKYGGNGPTEKGDGNQTAPATIEVRPLIKKYEFLNKYEMNSKY